MARCASLLLLFVSLLLSRCSTGSDTVAAGSSSTGNARVTCMVQTSGGQAAVNAAVSLLPADYLQSHEQALGKRLRQYADTVTNANGVFTFESIEPGSYVIEINDNISSAVLLLCTVTESDDIIDLGIDTLKAYATLTGTIEADSLAGRSAVMLYGLDRLALVDTGNGIYSFHDLPGGHYMLRIVSQSPLYGALDIAADPLYPGDTLAIEPVKLSRFESEDYSQWQHSGQISLNTTASGADISQNVYNFPLLIRLDSANFNFSEAHAKGLDIRFTDAQGKKLYCEIEQWDAPHSSAAVWVLLDTVFANTDTQAIAMYWGRNDAPDFSNGPKVFGAGAGEFQAVWHLSENPGSGRTGAVRDHSGTGNHGTAYVTMTSDNIIAGVSGPGMRFDGRVKGYPIICDPLQQSITGDVTLSFWYLLRDVQPYTPRMVDIGLNAQIDSGKAGFDNSGGPSTWLSDTLSTLDSMWHLFTATREATMYRLYIDGNYKGGVEGTVEPYSYLCAGRYYVNDGNNIGYTYFKGQLDEIRVTARANSPSWIKLSFESARTGQKLISCNLTN